MLCLGVIRKSPRRRRLSRGTRFQGVPALAGREAHFSRGSSLAALLQPQDWFPAAQAAAAGLKGSGLASTTGRTPRASSAGQRLPPSCKPSPDSELRTTFFGDCSALKDKGEDDVTTSAGLVPEGGARVDVTDGLISGSERESRARRAGPGEVVELARVKQSHSRSRARRAQQPQPWGATSMSAPSSWLGSTSTRYPSGCGWRRSAGALPRAAGLVGAPAKRGGRFLLLCPARVPRLPLSDGAAPGFSAALAPNQASRARPGSVPEGWAGLLLPPPCAARRWRRAGAAPASHMSQSAGDALPSPAGCRSRAAERQVRSLPKVDARWDQERVRAPCARAACFA